MNNFEYLIALLQRNEELEEEINSLKSDGEVEFLANEMCGIVDDYMESLEDE